MKAYGGRALIGAGTVLKPEQVDQLAGMGCKLVVTPNIQPEVIRRAVSYGMTVCPLRHGNRSLCCAGCRRTGVKNFPVVGVWSGLHQRAESGTSAGCSAICRRRRDAGKPAQWIKAGCVGAGLGSDLYRAGQSVERTAQQAAAFVNAYREAVK